MNITSQAYSGRGRGCTESESNKLVSNDSGMTTSLDSTTPALEKMLMWCCEGTHTSSIALHCSTILQSDSGMSLKTAEL